MNKQILTVLGCSGSIVLALSTPSKVEASNNQYIFNAPDDDAQFVSIPASEVDYPFFDCSCSEYNAAEIEQIDREGDKAISRFGCDCAGCRRLVRSLEKTEKTRN